MIIPYSAGRSQNKMNKRLEKNYIIAQCWGSVLMSAVLSLEMPLLASGSVTLASFCSGFIVSFLASMALKIFTPIIDTGQLLADKLGAKRGSTRFRIASTAFQAIMMGTCMSLLMNWWGMRNVPHLGSRFFNSWLHTYPYVLVSVFIMINVSIWTSSLIWGKKD